MARKIASIKKPDPAKNSLNRQELIDLLNEDLAREYQAIIAYVVYSQVIKGAAYMNIAAELEVHAAEELSHAITLANQIDYLGGMPKVTPRPVKTSDKAEDMLRFDLDNENETIRNYRQRVQQCEEIGEYALAEHLRKILMQEQDHQIALATALGVCPSNDRVAIPARRDDFWLPSRSGDDGVPDTNGTPRSRAAEGGQKARPGAPGGGPEMPRLLCCRISQTRY